jgi:hypothetical protein
MTDNSFGKMILITSTVLCPVRNAYAFPCVNELFRNYTLLRFVAFPATEFDEVFSGYQPADSPRKLHQTILYLPMSCSH